MSLKTWKAEFYHVDADSKIILDGIMATQHSLQKWRGLRKHNLDKHDLISNYDYIYDIDSGEYFYIDGKSCALCEYYTYCGSCILKQYLGKSCDDDRQPYHEFLETGNPEPMIAALEEIIKQHE